MVAVVDELTRERVDHARIEVTLTPTGPPGSAFTGKVELMTRGSSANYGAMVTIDPQAEYALTLTIRRPTQAEPNRAPFGPARIQPGGDPTETPVRSPLNGLPALQDEERARTNDYHDRQRPDLPRPHSAPSEGLARV